MQKTDPVADLLRIIACLHLAATKLHRAALTDWIWRMFSLHVKLNVKSSPQVLRWLNTWQKNTVISLSWVLIVALKCVSSDPEYTSWTYYTCIVETTMAAGCLMHSNHHQKKKSVSTLSNLFAFSYSVDFKCVIIVNDESFTALGNKNSLN